MCGSRDQNVPLRKDVQAGFLDKQPKSRSRWISVVVVVLFVERETERERETDRQRENLTCMNKTLKFFKCQPTHIIWYIQSKYLLVYTTKIPHPGKHYMHKEFQFMLVIMSVQMEFIDINVKEDGDIVKTQGRHHFC